VPIYTAYALTDGLTGPNTRDGAAIDVKLSDVFKFDAKTCPMALFHGGTDVYSPNGSTQIYRQLRRMKIPAEIHLFADRSPRVSWVTQPRGARAPLTITGLTESFEFFRQKNFDGRLGAEEDLMAYHEGQRTRRVPQGTALAEGKMPDVRENPGASLISNGTCRRSLRPRRFKSFIRAVATGQQPGRLRSRSGPALPE